MIPGGYRTKKVRYPLILSKMKDLRNNLERNRWYYTHSQSNTHYKGDGNKMSILVAEHIKKYYGEGETLVKALDDVSLSVERGEFVSIIGTSGSGKSTLLHMLGGLDNPTEGKIIIDDKDISELKGDALCIFRRRKIGFIFQSFNLVPSISVYDNIILPIQLDGKKVDKEYIDKVIETLGISKKLNVLPSKLSGGQQQRVAIARALASKPAIILADEPTGNLDTKTSQDVLGLLKTTGKKFNQTIVMITHNDEIAQMADRTIRIEDGHIV
jgi:ABC-type antimicrobial peptide transport system, ATPase component